MTELRGASDLAALFAAGVLPGLAYLAIGLWSVRALRLAERGAERLALGWVLGTGFASLALLGLRALDAPVPLAALAGIALAGVPLWRGPPASTDPRPAWLRAVDALAVALALLTFLAALGPETFWDGFEYHLPIVQAWSEGPIRALPGVLDAELRHGVDLLYLPAVAAVEPDAAAAVSAVSAAALAALVRAEATRRASPGAGAWAGLFVLCVPFTLDNAPSTYVDLAVGAYGFVALQRADSWNRGAGPRALLVAALCVGFAANAKLHAAILAPAALGVVAFGGRPPARAWLAGCAGVVAALALPWLVKVGFTTGNPFFPFLGDWLGYGPSDAAQLAAKRSDVYAYVRVERSVPGFLEYVASITYGRVYHIGGLLGPLPLALAPLAAARPSRATAALLVAGGTLFALQFAFMPALRFGAPLLPWLAVAAAVGGARLARSGPPAPAVLGAIFVLLALLHGAAALASYAPRIAALRAPRDYALALFPDQLALSEVVAAGEPVVAIPRGAVAWMPKPVYNLHWSRNGELFFDRRTPPDRALALLEERGVRSLAFDAQPAALREGRVGHPILDVWLDRGEAELRPGERPPARKGRVWVLLALRERPGAAEGSGVRGRP